MRTLFMGLLACTAVVCGCQQADDPVMIQQRQKYTLTEEPDGAVGVLEAREKYTAESPSGPLAVLGRVGTNPAQTWEPGKAAFVITDPTAEMPAHDHGDGHDHENCPFCQGGDEDVVDATALVRVLDPEGQIVSLDARELFDLSPGQLVVVRGSLSVDSLGNLIVAADGVYPRR